MSIYKRIKQLLLEVSPELAGRAGRSALIKNPKKDLKGIGRIEKKFKERGAKEAGKKPWNDTPEGRSLVKRFNTSLMSKQ